jgi:hypothetical protein
MVSLAEKPLTGEPDAGDPPVRFGGGDGATRHPYPILDKLKSEGGKLGAIRNADCAPKGARSRDRQRREFELKSECRKRRDRKSVV